MSLSRRVLIAFAGATSASSRFGLPAFADGKGAIGIAMPTKTSARWIADGDSMVAQFTAAGYEPDLHYAENDIPNPLARIEKWNIELFGGSPDDNNACFVYDGAMSVLQPMIDAGDNVAGSGQVGMDVVGTLRWDGAVTQGISRDMARRYPERTPQIGDVLMAVRAPGLRGRDRRRVHRRGRDDGRVGQDFGRADPGCHEQRHVDYGHQLSTGNQRAGLANRRDL